MAVTGFNHYNLRASRALLDALRDFYTDVVGLRPGARPPLRNFGYWLYIGEQAVLHLSEARADESRPAHVVGTFDHVAFSCRGLESMLAHLHRHGIDHSRSEVPGTGAIQLFFRDPAGNGVELNFSDDLPSA